MDIGEQETKYDINGAANATDPLEGAHPADAVTSVQSVIQPNQQSVIQTATNVQPIHLATKSNVILVSGKTNSVIQTTQGSLQAVQVDYVVETSEESMSNDEIDDTSPKKRRDILTRRPSYRKILNDLGGGEIAVIPASAIQLGSQGDGGIHTLSLNNSGGGGNTIVQYPGSEGQFFVPGPVIAEDQARKRELRLMKNREAARECRRKKKEYIKCLENRVAVLENQNKALIEELKSLKELYCQQKVE
ncbi:UNVERIFIED_CONTAM: hypothetical protein PYX00_010678 [Menopon gallinae]|uniref:Cyclic AMP response element-binding protein B n=1 Tax=Menopon gallinae TaxID=328185 RepID=A0AAW2HGI7_9NEOP